MRDDNWDVNAKWFYLVVTCRSCGQRDSTQIQQKNLKRILVTKSTPQWRRHVFYEGEAE